MDPLIVSSLKQYIVVEQARSFVHILYVAHGQRHDTWGKLTLFTNLTYLIVCFGKHEKIFCHMFVSFLVTFYRENKL